jgi:acyl carrier protein
MTTEPQAYDGLTEIFSDVFMRDDIALKPELTAKDVDGWDSFKQIEIIMAVEEKFGIKFQTRDLDTMKNVGDLIRLITAKS